MDLREMLAAVLEELIAFAAPTERTSLIGDSDLDGGVLNAVRQLTWMAALERASRSCGDGPWSDSGGSPAPASDCQRRAISSQPISVGGEDDGLTAALDQAGMDEATLRMGLENLDALQDALGDVAGFSSWLDTFGSGLVDAVLAGTRTEDVGDRVLVTSYQRRTGGGLLDIRVTTHFRRRPGAGAAAVRRFISTSTFKEKTMPTSTAVRHGEHASEAPPHMLTDVRFELVRLDERTPDGRRIHSEGFGVRDLPLSFSAMFTTQHSPGEAVLVGSIDEVTIEEDGRVWGQGWLLNEPDARRAGRLIQAGALRGNSVELSAEKVDLTFDETDEKMLVDFVSSKLSATTLVANPAMESCVVELVSPDFDFGEDAELTDAVSALASFTDIAPSVFSVAAPEKPRSDLPNPELFLDPGFTGPTQVTVDKDGAVYGHIALWDTPHLGSPAMTPPRTFADYAYFTVGEVLTSGGIFATGPLVIGDEHAAIHLGWRAAVDFYAATSRAWADVAVGEDEYGIWVAGMVRPGTDDATVHAARASGVSGDWRRIGGNLELVAVLSVNTPGFPVPQTELTDGRPSALVGIGHRFAPEVGLLQTVSADFAATVERFDLWLNRAEAERVRHNLEQEMRREAKDIASTL